MKKKILYFMMIFTLGFIFINDVSAICYKRTVIPGGDVTYVTSCTEAATSRGEISCEVVEAEYCNGGGDPSTGDSDSEKPAWLTSNKVSCGPIGEIPENVPEIFSLLILLFQIAVPVILVIYGMIDLSKGVMAQKEDEIKKGQQVFIKRIIAGALIFFIVALVKLLVGVVGDNTSNKAGIISCINCFLNGECVEAPSGGGGGGDPALDNPLDPSIKQEQFQ